MHIGPTDAYGWISGESFSDYVGRRGTYSNSSLAIDPFRTLGTVRSGFGLSAASLNGITLQLTALERYTPRNRVVYGFDVKSNVYYIDAQNHNASVIGALNASTLTNQSAALRIHRDALYAAYNVNATVAYLSRYSPLSGTPTWNSSFNVSLLAYAPGTAANGAPTAIKQVLLSWKGNLYAMHGNLIWYTAGTSGLLTNGATLPDSKIIKCASVYGNQIAIGASDNIVDNTYLGEPKVYFYDGFSQDWQKEVPFPDNDITELKFDGHDLIAFGPTGIFKYDGQGFIKLDDISGVVPAGGSDVQNGQIYFGASSNAIRAYGSPRPDIEKSFTRPMTGVGSNAIFKWVTANLLYTADSDGSIKRFSASSAESSASFTTRYIEAPNGSKFYLRAIRVSYQTLASGDSISLSVLDESTAENTIGTITYTNDGSSNPCSKEFTENSFTTGLGQMQKCRVRLALSGGSPKITSIDLLLETSKEI